ncbi:sulfatase-like hydrolase/transferase [Haloferula rosea]|uniref:Sulfatase-like hydrolase/transferase n=1 Tax=Haloferula rosea TaxID=490093 RepID=A0A934VE74_9BACT|nr:sulfatase-like hydrolase/transferase [Haloferula rosea]MBK1825677.1 sulfatase-like hydrolase/transferase [Haloferula rosea]
MACILSSAPVHASERPNILFIAVDDLVATLGCYGDPVALTPRIDGLAAEGMTFLNHHCQWAVCGPSRAALSTGLMPEETGVMGFKAIRHPDFLPDVITLPQHFKNEGYETACTGKFHDPRTVGDTSGGLTDDQFPNGSNVDDPLSWSIPYVKAASGYNPPGKPAVDASSTEPFSNYGDHHIKQEGLTLIDTLAGGSKPFFLAVGFKKPHLGFYAPDEFWALYDRNDMPLAPFTAHPAGASPYTGNTLDFHSELQGYSPYDTSWPPTDAQSRELVHGYYACVSMIDELVGSLLDKLAVTPDPLQSGKNLDETTVVVLWGDHGFHLGDHGRWGKHTAMEESTRCPLIILDPRTPTVPGSNTTTTPVNSIDIYPTLCELAGLSVPEQPLNDAVPDGRPIRGRSLVPLLGDPDASVHDGAITHFNSAGRYGYAYRTERFRYIEWVWSDGSVDGVDLYDYLDDPLETRNLAADPAYAGIVHQLSRSMRAETTTNGTGRLGLAAPSAVGADADLPDLSIEADGSGGIRLAWPDSGGVSYRVLGDEDLIAPWQVDAEDVSGSPIDLPITTARRFFRVAFDDNVPPVFVADPLKLADASLGEAYLGSLSTSVVDPGDALTFSKIDGPSWLVVGSDGALSGTPAELGAAWFTVDVVDGAGASANARLQISVVDDAPPPAPTKLEEFLFADAADTGLKDLTNSGTVGSSFEFNAADEIEADGLGRLMIGDDPGAAGVTTGVSKDWFRSVPFAADPGAGVYELEFRIDAWTLSTASGHGFEFALLDADGTALKTLFNSTSAADDTRIRAVDNGTGGATGQVSGFGVSGATGLTVRTTVDLVNGQWQVDYKPDGASGFSPAFGLSAISPDFAGISEMRLVVEGSTPWTAGDHAAIDYVRLTKLP